MSLPPKEKNERKDVDCKNRAVVPVTDSTVKRNHSKISNADDYVWAQEEQKMGAYSFMLMNFNLVKWRLASLKAYSASASGSSTRAKRRMADARMVLIKIYLIIRSYSNTEATGCFNQVGQRFPSGLK
jgi:2-oxoglutarate dehydrogenase E1 component